MTKRGQTKSRYTAFEKELIQEIKKLSTGKYKTPCSRARWRTSAAYSEHQIRQSCFGTFTGLMQAAGLTEGPVTRRVARFQERINYANSMADQVEAELMPWVRKKYKKPGKTVEMIIGSDFHAQYTDPFALHVFLENIRQVQPDIVVLAGDIVNFAPVSRWPQSPHKNLSLQEEIDFTVENIIGATREAAPNADIDIIPGNHEEWLFKYIMERAPSLASLRTLQLDELLQLKKYDVRLILDSYPPSKGMPAKLEKAAVLRNSQLYHDTFMVTHGTSTGQSPHLTELAAMGVPGCSGHVHSASSAIRPTIRSPHNEWNCLGMMANYSINHSYIHGRPNPHSIGYGRVTLIPEKRLHFFSHVHIRDGVALADGVLYTKKDMARQTA